ncbi:hypothetical protein [Streptomyces sp. MZ04]|uniref:DUF7715 family protein n=1 Tax=Streptomyces sp. MZ04 TaxID=2559236 RepID=UPI00107EC6A0|nr:hypothetical protein [Streptomyces sp. MZ04]TGB15504.1 hypothetical protein E2651_02455 [Streptomyces sp. MZ04]
MKLLVPALDCNYRMSNADYSWTDPGEILTIGTNDDFVGLDSGRFTTLGRVTDVNVTRAQVRQKITDYLTRTGWYEPGRERQSTETRKRMGEVFGLARGFDVGTVIELHQGRPRPITDPADRAAP